MNRDNPPIRLIATDLDGTLLRSDKTISRRTLEALGEAQERGIVVVIVSARPPRFLRELHETYGLDGIAICCNGAITYDVVNRRILQHHTMTPDAVKDLMSQLREAIPGICFAWESGERYGWEATYADLNPNLIGGNTITLEAHHLDNSPLTKLIVQHTDTQAEELLLQVRSITGADIVATYTGAPFIEIAAAGIERAAALKDLCAALNIQQSGVIAFGDMPNDLPMFAWAGRVVAVANAHPEVLAAASEITASNDDDGVAQVIETLQRFRETWAASGESEL